MARYDVELDLSGVQAPLNLLRTRKALESMDAGQTIHVITTALDSVEDFEALARHSGDTLVGKQTVRDKLHFVLRKN